VVATLATEAEPLRGAFNGAGSRLYVIHAGSPNLLVFSLPDLAVVGRLHVGMGAISLLVDPRTDLIYVGRRDDSSLTVYNPFSLLPLDRFDVGDPAAFLALEDTENLLYAVQPERRSVAVVDLAGHRLRTVLDVGDGPSQLSLVGERR
jgi:hypothetical protein